MNDDITIAFTKDYIYCCLYLTQISIAGVDLKTNPGRGSLSN